MTLRWPKPRFDPFLLLAVLIVVFAGAYDECRSWNDGSRLATVESLVDFHTWQIDDSAYTYGMSDKVFINGHFYSDKAPVFPLAMAGVYKVLQVTTGLQVRENRSRFYYLLTVIFTGTAYVLSVMGMERLVAATALPAIVRVALTWSFAFGTIAFAYSRVINNHLIFLAVIAALYWFFLQSTAPGWARFTLRQRLAIGTLLGLGYTVDLAVGPLLVIGAVIWLLCRAESIKGVGLILLAAFPWFALHHALNYQIGGTFIPVASVTANFQWQGSALAGLDGRSPNTIAGAGWQHHGLGDFLAYAFGLLFERDRGFVLNNLVLWLALPAMFVVAWRKEDKSGLAYLSLGLFLGTWLMYAATSNNYSGQCCSVRWLIPLLVPLYYSLAVFLQKHPATHIVFLILSVWAVILGCLLWWHGPWSLPIGPAVGYVDGLALFSVFAFCAYQRSRKIDALDSRGTRESPN